MVRLSGGVYSNEGTVEVYCNGAWGRVCNASTDANVICTQLGYTGSPKDTAVLVISFLSLPTSSLPLSLSLSLSLSLLFSILPSSFPPSSSYIY